MARQMKDSGVEWIGEIPEDWECIKIKQLADRNIENSFVDGDWIESPYIEDEGIRYLTTGNIGDGVYKNQGNGYISLKTFNLLGCKYAYPDDLVFSRLNSPYGRSCILPNDFDKYVLAVDNVILRPLNNVVKKYICFFSQCKGYQESAFDYAKGTTMKRISRSNLGNICIVLPSKDQQQKIADFLDEKVGEIDFVIAKTKEIIEDYKKYKQTIITDTVTKGLNPDVEMKESGIKWIGNFPKHWEILRMKNISEEIGDGLHSTPEYDENGDVFFVNGNNIGNEYLEIKENTNKLNEIELKKYKLSLLNENTILIALNGATYGKTSFYNGEKVLLGKSAGYITLREKCNKKYVRYFLQSYSAKYFMALSLNGTTIQNLSLNTLNNFYMTFPNEDEQKEIAEYLDEKCSEIDKLVAKKEELLVDLENYKKSLIYEYVTGKKEIY